MKPLERIWHSQGILSFVYLEDILVLGKIPQMVRKHLTLMATSLLEASFKMNTKKSILTPSQCIPHLGTVLNLAQGKLEVPSPNLRSIRKAIGKFLFANQFKCRTMASILGQIL